MIAIKRNTVFRTAMTERRLATLRQYMESNPEFQGNVALLAGSITAFQNDGFRAHRLKNSPEVYPVFCPVRMADKGVAEYLTRNRIPGSTLFVTEIGTAYVNPDIEGVYRFSRMGAFALFFGLDLEEAQGLFGSAEHSEDFADEVEWITRYLEG